MNTATEPPVLRVLRGGEPSDDELAALTAVLTMHWSVEPDRPGPLRRPLSPWVASGLTKGTRTKA